jgi:flagellar basal body-associated protein FliL
MKRKNTSKKVIRIPIMVPIILLIIFAIIITTIFGRNLIMKNHPLIRVVFFYQSARSKSLY